MKTQAETQTNFSLLEKLFYPSRESIGKATPTAIPEATTVNHQVLQVLQRNLHAIIGHCEIAATQKTAILPAEIQDSAEQALHLVQMLRLYQESQATGEVLNRGRCRLALFLDLLESLVGPEARRKGVTFDVFQEDALPNTLFTHQRGLRTALLQLLDDALQQAEVGKAVQLSVAELQVDRRQFIAFTVITSTSEIPQTDFSPIHILGPKFDFPDQERGWRLRLAIARGWATQLGGLLESPRQSSGNSLCHLIVPVNETVPRTLDSHTASILTLLANKRLKR